MVVLAITDHHIVQLSPSPGWRAVFTFPDGNQAHAPVACWALLQETSPGEAGGGQWAVAGIDQRRAEYVFFEDDPNFTGYVYG